MANFFSASQEEQQEILLSIWQRFKYVIIVFFVLLVVFIVSRDFIRCSCCCIEVIAKLVKVFKCLLVGATSGVKICHGNFLGIRVFEY